MPMRTFQLHVGPTGRSARVLLDGEEVKNTRAVSIRSGVDEPTSVILEIINVDVVVHAEIDESLVQFVETTPITAANREYRKV